jgi:hypothetical protein
MHISNDKNGIIINSNQLPIIRAGYANIIFLLLAVVLILANQILVDFSSAIVLRILVLLAIFILILKIYTHSLSRIYVDEKNLVFIRPISKSIIDTTRIMKTKVYGIPSSMTIFIQIKKRGELLPLLYFFVATSTNCGSYMDTKAKLISLLRKLGSQE